MNVYQKVEIQIPNVVKKLNISESSLFNGLYDKRITWLSISVFSAAPITNLFVEGISFILEFLDETEYLSALYKNILAIWDYSQELGLVSSLYHSNETQNLFPGLTISKSNMNSIKVKILHVQ